jgi:hypothetical protein
VRDHILESEVLNEAGDEGGALLGIAVWVFIGVCAVDVFAEGKPFAQTVARCAMHVVPSLVLLAIVAVAWPREWVGALVMLSAVVWYGVVVARGRLDRILVIAGPLVVVGLAGVRREVAVDTVLDLSGEARRWPGEPLGIHAAHDLSEHG